MNISKKSTSLFLFIFIFGLGLQVAEAKRFSDYREIPQWAEKSIDTVQDSKIMTGFGDGSFKPNKKLNRAEALTLLFRIKGLDPKDINTSSVFPDVPDEAWFAPAVIEATARGWIKGFPDGTFRPGNTLNKAEWATLIMRSFDLEPQNPDPDHDDVPSNAWFARPVTAMVKNNLIRIKSRKFNPASEVTRADAAWLMAKILGMPRILGTSKQNDLSRSRRTSSRRVAIKPRDFNAYKQGYDIAKKELLFTAKDEGGVRIFRRDSGWGSVGSVEIANNLEERSKLHSITLELRFDQTNIGPVDSFDIKIEGAGLVKEKELGKTGEVSFTGLNLDIESEETVEFEVFLKPREGEFFYSRIGQGAVFVNFGDGSSMGTFEKENSKRMGDFKYAPVGYGNRKMRVIEFRP